MKRPYKKVVSYHFEVLGEEVAITDISDTYVHVEETRKNGQEDCHMSGDLVRGDDGKFDWDDTDIQNSFVTYGAQSLADGIVDYINTHGLPGRKK